MGVQSTGSVFISYRREDSAGSARRVYDRLVMRLPREAVFIDVDNIPLGVDFVQVLSERVGACDVLIAIIGREWINVREGGRRRIDNPHDFVRIEIEAALKRDVHVIPVLVDGARMPSADELPESLRPLARRNAIEVSHTRFDMDAQRLTHGLEQLLAQRAAAIEEATERERRRREEADTADTGLTLICPTSAPINENRPLIEYKQENMVILEKSNAFHIAPREWISVIMIVVGIASVTFILYIYTHITEQAAYIHIPADQEDIVKARQGDRVAAYRVLSVTDIANLKNEMIDMLSQDKFGDGLFYVGKYYETKGDYESASKFFSKTISVVGPNDNWGWAKKAHEELSKLDLYKALRPQPSGSRIGIDFHPAIQNGVD
jgi:hypothetical protein